MADPSAPSAAGGVASQKEVTNGLEEDRSLYTVQILIDELRNEDMQLRLNSVRNLDKIVRALGSDRTRDDLLPLLTDSIDDEDEVLLALAEELGNLLEATGGAKHAKSLLTPLNKLASVEEVAVREKSVESIMKIAEALSKEQFQAEIVPLVLNLASSSWPTSRTSASGLFGVCYKRGNEDTKSSIVEYQTKLVSDDAPMVRRAAATNMKLLIAEMPAEKVKEYILPVFGTIGKDEQDSVRLLVVESCVALAKVLSAEDTKAHVLGTVNVCAQDDSWRVRYMLAQEFRKLCQVFGEELTRASLVDPFVSLLGDSEAEVRTAAAAQVSGVAASLTVEQSIERLLPCAKDLVVDPSEHVRASLASVIMALAPIFGTERTTEHLLDLFLLFLKDENPEVRLNIISKLGDVNKVIGIDLLSQSLLPAIVELAEEKQWRVRLAIIEHIPLLAKQLGEEYFNAKLGGLCMAWLADKVYSIREAATTNLQKLTEVFGVEWAEATILPKVLGLHQNSNYLHRMTSLFAIGALAKVVPLPLLKEKMVPLLVTMAEDPVPNIRFNVAKVIRDLIPLLDKPTLQTTIKGILTKLESDADKDVKFFALEAKKKLSA